MNIHGSELQLLMQVTSTHNSESPLVEDRFYAGDLPWAIDPAFLSGLHMTNSLGGQKIIMPGPDLTVQKENICGVDCYVVNDTVVVSPVQGLEVPDEFYSKNPALNILISSIESSVKLIESVMPVERFSDPPLLERPVFTAKHEEDTIYHSTVTLSDAQKRLAAKEVKCLATFTTDNGTPMLFIVFTMNGFTIGYVSMKYEIPESTELREMMNAPIVREMTITDYVLGVQEKMGVEVIGPDLKSKTLIAHLFNEWTKKPLTNEC